MLHLIRFGRLCVSHYRGEESSAYIIDRSLMRPRNVIKIVNHARGFATNFNRAKIGEEEIEKGVHAYSQDLLVELDRELYDILPEAKDLLYHFADAPEVLGKRALSEILTEAGIIPDEAERVTDFLLYYGVVGIVHNDAKCFIFDVSYDLKIMKIRSARAGDEILYVINPAFVPALGIKEIRQPDLNFEDPPLPL
jgi:hypothetical protein